MPRIKPKDHAGRRFDRWMAIELTSKRTRWGGAIWKCKCDCGIIREISAGSLIHRFSRSCGCLQKDSLRKRLSKPRGEASFNIVFKSYRDNGDGRPFSITQEHFRTLIAGDCFYCGRKPFNIYKSLHGTGDLIYNGIDRVDSSRGYETDNVVTCCKTCNRAKMAMSISEFKDWVNLVHAHWASQ